LIVLPKAENLIYVLINPLNGSNLIYKQEMFALDPKWEICLDRQYPWYWGLILTSQRSLVCI